MKRWKWVLLVFELALFALILVMPQVNLPDFAFHGGSAPVLAKARMSAAMAATQVVPQIASILLPAWILNRSDSEGSPHPDNSYLSLSQLCLLLC